jgi:hypothetical protein
VGSRAAARRPGTCGAAAGAAPRPQHRGDRAHPPGGQKGLVERAGDGRRYTYRPAGDPDQLTARAIERLLAAVGDRRAVLAHLVIGTEDPGLRAELAALIRDSNPEGHREDPR